MSGGVDSSVALVKILEMGYDAVGVTMKLWQYDDVGGNIRRENSCCSIDEMNGARLVCHKMGVPHYTIDFTDVFRQMVVDNFAEEYFAGRTPNPCVRCNSFVKWDAFIRQGELLGVDMIATGHYARIDYRNGEPVLLKGVDLVKDQAYVLWGIPRETLRKTLLPLGGLTKKQVRAIAGENDLATAQTPESMEICFVADNNYKRFLREYKPHTFNSVGPGNIIEGDQVVGTHPGYTHYTVGQRKGLGLSKPEPRYVQKVDARTNTIYVGKKNSLFREDCFVSAENWLVSALQFPREAEIQIRYNSRPVPGTIYRDDDHRLRVEFREPQLSVTPGQSIVFYDHIDTDLVLGGGIID